MGLVDKLRRAGGIVKNRLASATSAIRTQARAISVRIPRSLRFTARAARLTSPLGIAITGATFAPQIVRGIKTAAAFVGPSIRKGVAFFGGRQVVQAAGAGGVVGVLTGRKSGSPTRPSEAPISVTRTPTPSRKPKPTTRKKAPGVRAKPRKRKPVKKRRSLAGKKGITHRKPRHRGHTRVSFTTKDGKKVRFLAAKTPKGRHR